MDYQQLSQAIQAYTETTEQLFVANIPVFIQQAETRIYNSVYLPALRKNVLGTATRNNKYLSCPDDFLAVYSIAAIRADGSYEYLLNKDVNFIRAAYPNPTEQGLPRYYALFGPQYTAKTELSFILGPTPDINYPVELHYFFYPPTIVQGEIKTLSQPTPGSSYTDGLYLGVSLTGGAGSNAYADITVAGGVVTSVVLQNGGSMYVLNDVLSCPNTSIGNTGTGFSVTVASVSNATGRSWVGDNYDPVLLYGSLREAVIFQKGEQDMVQYYEQKYQEALAQMIRLGDAMEISDAYRSGQPRMRAQS